MGSGSSASSCWSLERHGAAFEEVPAQTLEGCVDQSSIGDGWLPISICICRLLGADRPRGDLVGERPFRSHGDRPLLGRYRAVGTYSAGDGSFVVGALRSLSVR